MVAERQPTPREYLDVLRFAKSLEDAEQWAEQHPIAALGLVPDPVWCYGLLGSTALPNPDGLVERGLAVIEARRRKWAGPPRRVPPPRTPLYLRAPVPMVALAARQQARRPWWRRWLDGAR